MNKATLEQRVNVPEKTVAEAVRRSKNGNQGRDWRSTIGMFANDPLVKEIQLEGRKVREAE